MTYIAGRKFRTRMKEYQTSLTQEDNIFLREEHSTTINTPTQNKQMPYISL